MTQVVSRPLKLVTLSILIAIPGAVQRFSALYGLENALKRSTTNRGRGHSGQYQPRWSSTGTTTSSKPRQPPGTAAADELSGSD
jgi:hypothetical protein